MTSLPQSRPPGVPFHQLLALLQHSALVAPLLHKVPVLPQLPQLPQLQQPQQSQHWWQLRKLRQLRRQVRLLAPCACAVLATFASGAVHAQPVSPAEVLLFETDHVGQLKAPVTLVYDFRKVSNVEPGFSDKVQLDLADIKGKRSAAMHFLSGERERTLPAVDDVHGNPVLLGFLERDIAEMKRLTGGSATYFRKRIRMALAGRARVTEQAVHYGGKALQAKVVRIQPYLDDPMASRFARYVNKTYTFVVSEQAPGGVLELSTSLASPGQKGAAVSDTDAKAPAAAPVIDETLTLVKADLSRH